MFHGFLYNKLRTEYFDLNAKKQADSKPILSQELGEHMSKLTHYNTSSQSQDYNSIGTVVNPVLALYSVMRPFIYAAVIRNVDVNFTLMTMIIAALITAGETYVE